MPRKKIKEHKAKTILFQNLSEDYYGLEIDTTKQNWQSSLNQINFEQIVIKVDQGIKQRMKKGLMKVNIKKGEVLNFIQKLQSQDYSQFICEPLLEHSSENEHYLSLQLIREGIQLLYSNQGGINIEDNTTSIQKYIIQNTNLTKNIDEAKTQTIHLNNIQLNLINEKTKIPINFLQTLIKTFTTNHFTFLEINPLVIQNNKIYILDLAVEVDTAGQYFNHNAWNEKDYISAPDGHTSQQQKSIDKLSSQSQASFNFTSLNPNGSIWMLLSGGGASLVLADEVYNLGHGKQLANYGEYSGGPNNEETYIYTKNVLQLMQKSKAIKKAIIIGGGVANFTDIKKTFKGIIKAIDEAQVAKNNIKFFVRRGGPNQQQGLLHMEQFLKKNNIYGYVAGPEMPLTDIIHKALKYIDTK